MTQRKKPGLAPTLFNYSRPRILDTSEPGAPPRFLYRRWHTRLLKDTCRFVASHRGDRLTLGRLHDVILYLVFVLDDLTVYLVSQYVDGGI